MLARVGYNWSYTREFIAIVLVCLSSLGYAAIYSWLILLIGYHSDEAEWKEIHFCLGLAAPVTLWLSWVSLLLLPPFSEEVITSSLYDDDAWVLQCRLRCGAPYGLYLLEFCRVLLGAIALAWGLVLGLHLEGARSWVPPASLLLAEGLGLYWPSLYAQAPSLPQGTRPQQLLLHSCALATATGWLWATRPHRELRDAWVPLSASALTLYHVFVGCAMRWQAGRWLEARRAEAAYDVVHAIPPTPAPLGFTWTYALCWFACLASLVLAFWDETGRVTWLLVYTLPLAGWCAREVWQDQARPRLARMALTALACLVLVTLTVCIYAWPAERGWKRAFVGAHLCVLLCLALAAAWSSRRPARVRSELSRILPDRDAAEQVSKYLQLQASAN